MLLKIPPWDCESGTVKNPEPKHRRFGTPMTEWINLVGELDIDAIGFWQVIGDGREGFGLEGVELDDFIRQRLTTLFDHGAFPVRHVPGDQTIWTAQTNYGETPGVMAENITKEWDEQGRPNPGLGDLWFATPSISNYPFKT